MAIGGGGTTDFRNPSDVVEWGRAPTWRLALGILFRTSSRGLPEALARTKRAADRVGFAAFALAWCVLASVAAMSLGWLDRPKWWPGAAFRLGTSVVPLGLMAFLVVFGRRLSRICARAEQFAGEICPDCAYPLRGLPERHVCPDCGLRYSLPEAREQWKRCLTSKSDAH